MAINKVIYGGRTLIDLSGDTVTADKILDGFTAHDKKGETIAGTCKYDVDSSDATAAVAEILLRMSNIQFLRDIMMVLVKLEL